MISVKLAIKLVIKTLHRIYRNPIQPIRPNLAILLQLRTLLRKMLPKLIKTQVWISQILFVLLICGEN